MFPGVPVLWSTTGAPPGMGRILALTVDQDRDFLPPLKAPKVVPG